MDERRDSSRGECSSREAEQEDFVVVVGVKVFVVVTDESICLSDMIRDT